MPLAHDMPARKFLRRTEHKTFRMHDNTHHYTRTCPTQLPLPFAMPAEPSPTFISRAARASPNSAAPVIIFLSTQNYSTQKKWRKKRKKEFSKKFLDFMASRRWGWFLQSSKTASLSALFPRSYRHSSCASQILPPVLVNHWRSAPSASSGLPHRPIPGHLARSYSTTAPLLQRFQTEEEEDGINVSEEDPEDSPDDNPKVRTNNTGLWYLCRE
jgi:hypothetical protein